MKVDVVDPPNPMYGMKKKGRDFGRAQSWLRYGKVVRARKLRRQRTGDWRLRQQCEEMVTSKWPLQPMGSTGRERQAEAR